MKPSWRRGGARVTLFCCGVLEGVRGVEALEAEDQEVVGHGDQAGEEQRVPGVRVLPVVACREREERQEDLAHDDHKRQAGSRIGPRASLSRLNPFW